MFMLNGNRLQIDTPFAHMDISYPANWLRLASPAERSAIGIEEIPDPISFDNRFWWDAGLPKDLDDLKAEWNRRLDDIAFTMLAPSDWMVIRKQETGDAIPENWQTYRNAVRLACTENKTLLSNSTDIEDFVAKATTLIWPTAPA